MPVLLVKYMVLLLFIEVCLHTEQQGNALAGKR